MSKLDQFIARTMIDPKVLKEIAYEVFKEKARLEYKQAFGEDTVLDLEANYWALARDLEKTNLVYQSPTEEQAKLIWCDEKLSWCDEIADPLPGQITLDQLGDAKERLTMPNAKKKTKRKTKKKKTTRRKKA